VGFDAEMYDIERIEVLRGPQGTLYGKNTEAGAINVITRQPGNNFTGRIALEGGEDKKKQTILSISGPLVKDKLYLGFSGRYYEKDGFITHADTGETMDDKKRWAGRINYAGLPLIILMYPFLHHGSSMTTSK
jgi:iron complex outermembrane receptor protein